MVARRRPATFPDFCSLSPEWYGWYQERLYELPQQSDFTLNNMLVWLGGDCGVECSAVDGSIVLRVSSSRVEALRGTWLTLLGPAVDRATLDLVLQLAPGHKLRMVPDYVVSTACGADHVVAEDRDNFDYILDVEGLAQMTGKKYERFRYQVRRFERLHGSDAAVRELNLRDPSDAAAVLGALVAWPRVNSFGPGGNDPTRTDQRAIEQLIRLQPELSVRHRCLGVFIRGRLRGFSIFHVPHARDPIGMGNHIKYDASFDRMFDYLVHVTACDLREQGIHRVNADVDLGMPGLRRHKMQLRPVEFYKKYTVSGA